MNLRLGANDFFGVPFPLVVGNRYFHVYKDGDRFNLDIFRWDPVQIDATYEVIAGEANEPGISSNATGIVTFGRESDGAFLFKFRPKSGTSQLFGSIPTGGELRVVISDKDIRVFFGDVLKATLEGNQMIGGDIGILIEDSGSMAMGVAGLPAGMVIERRPTA